jgi:hypothetical protein
MSQTQERKTVQPAIARSEELVDRIGRNIGSFAGLAWQRTQQTATRVGTGKAQGEQPSQPEGKHMGGIPQAEMQKAEGLVDDMGQRIGLLTTMTGLQIRKMAAYAREGAEDILAEAQHLRSVRSNH